MTTREIATGLHVLVVDDEADTRGLVAEVLGQEGFRVTAEASGERAIAAVERERFDAVVVGRELPRVSGLDLVSFLTRRAPDVPVILITAFGGPLVAHAARCCGASGYLEKPLRPQELVETLRAVTRRRTPALAGAPSPVSLAPPPQPVTRAVSRGVPGRSPWAIILAGGRGTRLRPLTQRLFGDGRPKQYVALMGSRSMLRQTLDRTALAIPPERTVVVSVAGQAKYLAPELGGLSAPPTVLLQPADRGTAAAVLWPAHWIHRRDPEAIVTVFPSDHFILEEHPFMERVLDAVRFVEGDPRWMVLLGARPTYPEAEYGWIEPGDTLGWTPSGPVRTVRRFLEKPSPLTARACMAQGDLWNTFVFVATVSTLIEAGRQFAWRWHEQFARLPADDDSDAERRATRRAYEAAPAANFSSAVLQNCGPILAVLALAGVSWCDWGSPRRVIRTLRELGLRPAWLEGRPSRRPERPSPASPPGPSTALSGWDVTDGWGRKQPGHP